MGFPSAPAPVESERVLLRRLVHDDLPDLLDVHASDEVTRFLPYETWRSPADAEAWYTRMEARHAEGSAQQYVAVLKPSGRVIGTCLLFRFDEASARAELGYALGRPFWGSGLMREALQLTLAVAFDTLGLRRLEAEVDPRNLASDRLLRRLGFTHEGCLRQRWVVKGEAKDSNVYGLLRHEWAAAQAGAAALSSSRRAARNP